MFQILTNTRLVGLCTLTIIVSVNIIYILFYNPGEWLSWASFRVFVCDPFMKFLFNYSLYWTKTRCVCVWWYKYCICSKNYPVSVYRLKIISLRKFSGFFACLFVCFLTPSLALYPGWAQTILPQPLKGDYKSELQCLAKLWLYWKIFCKEQSLLNVVSVHITFFFYNESFET